MTTYRSLFAIREFRVLFVARLFTMVGVVVGALALGTVMYDATDSTVLTALSMFGGPLVSLVTSHFLLASSDLLRPRTALVVTGAAAAGDDLLQLIPHLPWGVRFALLAMEYVITSATSGTVMSLLADIVPAESFVLARATMNLTVGGIQVLGNALGAVLLLAFAPVHLFAVSAAAAVFAAVIARLGVADHPPRATGPVVARTRTVNKALLGSRVVRPVLLMGWIPNGLIVGCEALYIPYARQHAGYLFASTAAGMLAGDVVVGRFVPEAVRQRLVVPLRLLLAVPFLVMFAHPPVVLAALAGGIGAFGYTASLPLQSRLVQHVRADSRGQAFGLLSAGLMVGQSLGALAAGVLGQLGAPGPAMGTVAALSIVATTLLVRPLRRSAPRPDTTRHQATPV
ncbi:hypothetical protein EFY87_15325 [Flexivirga caeni]|uniref:MFS transporter n=1 Tax=Flexivirga caeni TaxID=2294115 RepID=A0A3M9M4D4_9MICO|nr:hypothetical protein EFY87_15325 [Flexivirga caeni]